MTADYSLSSKAVADLEGIYEFTILNFGLKQARAYLLGIHEHFQMLSEYPKLGRCAEHLAPELRRHEYQSHVIYYKLQEQGLLIVRVLHETMDAPRHM